MLTIRLHLVPSLRLNGAIPPFPLYALRDISILPSFRTLHEAPPITGLSAPNRLAQQTSSAPSVANHRWGRFHGSLRHLTLLNHTTAIKNIGHTNKPDTERFWKSRTMPYYKRLQNSPKTERQSILLSRTAQSSRRFSSVVRWNGAVGNLSGVTIKERVVKCSWVKFKWEKAKYRQVYWSEVWLGEV
jgi:hypothetical protein